MQDRQPSSKQGPHNRQAPLWAAALVLRVIAVYLVLLMASSLPFVALHWPPGAGWWAFPYTVFPFA